MRLRYRTIAGEFHIHYPDIPRNGPQPDGDTISFKADDPSLIESLPRFGFRRPDINTRGIIGVRFEAIDSLETHFRGSHQEPVLAYMARDFMLAHMGFRDIVFYDDMPDVVRSVSNNPLRGHILANGIDGNGRVLAFVYPGDSAEPDGAPTFVDAELMRASANLAVLNAGLAYAAIYTSLPLDLAEEVRVDTRAVRARGDGIFGHESLDTTRSAPIAGLAELETMVMWPKLYRRLVTFFAAGRSDLEELDGWLREDIINRDDRLILTDGEFGNMHDLFTVEAGAMRMNHNPEEVTILPDNA
jgi:hypothetical protein